MDLFSLVYKTNVPRELIEFTEREQKDEEAKRQKIRKEEENHRKIVEQKHNDIANYLQMYPEIDLKIDNPYAMSLIALTVTYDIEFLFDQFLEKRIYSPNELREIKNSADYNLITICRLFEREKYAEKIRDYVKNY